MQALAAMLGAGLPLRCVALSQGGYDTHDDQPEDLTQDLKAAADTLLAFQRDIEARGLADRVSCRSGRNSAAAARRTPPREPTTALPASAS